MSPVFLTIVSSNYLAYARTLFASIQTHYPTSRRVLCIADAPELAQAEFGRDCTVLQLDDLALPHKEHFLYRYGVMELNTAVKPYALRWIARNLPEASGGVMYIDPDIQFFRPLTEVENLFAAGAMLVLTPHLTAPLNDDKTPSELSILRAGAYNCGFVAIGPHKQRDAFLDWWCKRLEHGAYVDFEAGLFTDQKWMDLAPGLFPDVIVLRHPGYNVAYWNLANRPFAIDRQGKYTAGEEPLAFFHFSGVDPHDPKLLSKHQTRFTESDLGVFRPAYRIYLQALLANGYDRYSKVSYAYGRTKFGAPIVPEMRQTFRNRYDVNSPEPTADPFGLGPVAFDFPARHLPKAPPRVSTLLYEAWKRRDELRQSFDIYSADGREGLLAWSVSVGTKVLGVSPEFLDSSKRELLQFRASRWPVSAGRSKVPGFQFFVLARRSASEFSLLVVNSLRHSSRIRRLYYHVPPALRKSAQRALSLAIGKFSAWSAPALGAVLVETESTHSAGINIVVGPPGERFDSAAAQAFARAAALHGPATMLISVKDATPQAPRETESESPFAHDSAHSVNLLFIDPDEMSLRVDQLGPVLRGRYNIGYWHWESEPSRRACESAMLLLDEVWVASDFLRVAVTRLAGAKSVRHVPYPVVCPVERHHSREEYGLRDGQFIFLVEVGTDLERANPAAVVAAFRLAFPEVSGVSLAVRSVAAASGSRTETYLRNLIGTDPRMLLIGGELDHDVLLGLRLACDASVSLHRYTALGVELAQAMFIGKPVIATAYSGNLEFMKRDNSCLVSSRIVDVPVSGRLHTAGLKWAEPSVEDAARWMRRIHEDNAFREDIAGKGQEFVRQNMSQLSASQAIARELNRIMQLRRPRAA